MTVINLKTGNVRTTKEEPLPKCEIAFCNICKIGIIQMLIDDSRE